jgi:hypothetical protein
VDRREREVPVGEQQVVAEPIDVNPGADGILRALQDLTEPEA